jgi:hypothetical protein
MDQSKVRDLFTSIPRTDPLQLFEGSRPKGQAIADFLSLRTKDVARATHLSPTSVRYDLRMPELLETWLRDVATTVTLVAEFFGDAEKTKYWFFTPNPQLGNMEPVDLIKLGRARKLLTFVQTALEENKKDNK